MKKLFLTAFYLFLSNCGQPIPPQEIEMVKVYLDTVTSKTVLDNRYYLVGEKKYACEVNYITYVNVKVGEKITCGWKTN